jgi:hypothetical protein
MAIEIVDISLKNGTYKREILQSSRFFSTKTNPNESEDLPTVQPIMLGMSTLVAVGV